MLSIQVKIIKLYKFERIWKNIREKKTNEPFNRISDNRLRLSEFLSKTISKPICLLKMIRNHTKLMKTFLIHNSNIIQIPDKIFIQLNTFITLQTDLFFYLHKFYFLSLDSLLILLHGIHFPPPKKNDFL